MAGSLKLHFLRREDLKPLKYSLSFREIPQKCGVFCLKMAIFGSFFISFLDLFQNTPNKWAIPLIKPQKTPSPDKKSGIFAFFGPKMRFSVHFCLCSSARRARPLPRPPGAYFRPGTHMRNFQYLERSFETSDFFPKRTRAGSRPTGYPETDRVKLSLPPYILYNIFL